jgi:hypothetical protein
MENSHNDPVDGIDAEVADVIEQAQPAASQPAAEALASRSRFDATDPIDSANAEVADVIEQAQPVGSEPTGGALDPEATGIELEEADDSRQA